MKAKAKVNALSNMLADVEANTLIDTVPEVNEETPVHGLADFKTEGQH